MLKGNIKQVQEKLLDMLVEIQRICDENNITYFMAYGSLLGTIRHEGFIPWDDDMDIMMERSDYNKFLEVASQTLKYPYVLQFPGNDSSCFYGGYAKVRNSNTTALEMLNWGHRCNQGISIDILPIDVVTESQEKFKNQMQDLHVLQGLLYAKAYGKEGFKNFKALPPEEWFCYQEQEEFIEYSHLCQKLDECLTRYNEENSKWCSALTHFSKEKRIYPMSVFSKTEVKRFEGIEVKVPVGYEQILRTCYGDYEVIPGTPKIKSNYKVFYNAKVGYETYNGRLINIFEKIGDRKIILCGEGEMIKGFLRKYEGIRECICVGEKPEDIAKTYSELKIDESIMVICSENIESIEEIFLTVGVEEYYIYTPDRKWLFLRG